MVFRDKICFLYVCGRGNFNTHELDSVSENENCYHGITRSGYRTFRKDRIIQFADTAVELTHHLRTFNTNDWLKHYLLQQILTELRSKSVLPVLRKIAKLNRER